MKLSSTSICRFTRKLDNWTTECHDSDRSIFQYYLHKLHFNCQAFKFAYAYFNSHRKGLSKYYRGKSQSFTSISDATCVQDLAKKISYSKRMKMCKSYSAGLDMNQQSTNLPRASKKVIAKRPSNASVAKVMSRTSNTSHLYSRSKPSAHQKKRDTNAYWSVTKWDPEQIRTRVPSLHFSLTTCTSCIYDYSKYIWSEINTISFMPHFMSHMKVE
jgi:hypothetical protein